MFSKYAAIPEYLDHCVTIRMIFCLVQLPDPLETTWRTMRHIFILNESGFKWGETSGNNSAPWPNCTFPFITPTVKPVLLAIKFCYQVWLQGVSKVTPKSVHNYCKTVLVLENEISNADKDLCTIILDIRTPNFRGLHLHDPHKESTGAANWETTFDMFTKESLKHSKQGILNNVGKYLLQLTVRL